MSDDPRAERIVAAIRQIPDFPKPGINFRDISTLLLDPEAFQQTVDLFVERYKGKGIDAVAGFEARGFIIGAPVALALGCAFVLLRKPGKLPGKTVSAAYVLEYGEDKIEMHVDAVKPGQKVVLIDDLVATGGTAAAGTFWVKLMREVGADTVEVASVLELKELKGRDKLGVPLFAIATLSEFVEGAEAGDH